MYVLILHDLVGKTEDAEQGEPGTPSSYHQLQSWRRHGGHRHEEWRVHHPAGGLAQNLGQEKRPPLSHPGYQVITEEYGLYRRHSRVWHYFIYTFCSQILKFSLRLMSTELSLKQLCMSFSQVQPKCSILGCRLYWECCWFLRPVARPAAEPHQLLQGHPELCDADGFFCRQRLRTGMDC